MAILNRDDLVLFYKLLESELENEPIIKGKILFTTDTKKLFLDILNNENELERIEIDHYDITADESERNILTFTMPDGNTKTFNLTYTASDGIELVDHNFTNTGVRSIATGETNGTISVNTNGVEAEVAIAGLGTAAFSNRGVPNGIAELDNNGKVPSSQLPSYVDDVIEGYYNTTDHNFYKEKNPYSDLIDPEADKIYVDLDTNLTYRWSGSEYVEISPSLALGTTHSTAYYGDYGEIAYEHAIDPNKNNIEYEVGLYKIGITNQGHISQIAPITKVDITNLGIPAQDTVYTAGDGIEIDENNIISATGGGGGGGGGSDVTYTPIQEDGNEIGYITIDGNSTMIYSKDSATYDGNGNNIEDTYVNISGDTMTGKLYFSQEGFEDYDEAGFIHDQYGNMQHKRANLADHWNIQDQNGNKRFKVYPETGVVETETIQTQEIDIDAYVMKTAKINNVVHHVEYIEEA